MEKKNFYLPEMTEERVKEVVNKSVLLVPVATVEQHGAHLPLHTDIDNVTSIMVEVAKKLNPDPMILVAPPFWLSPSPFSAQKYPGTVNIRKETFIQVLNDLLESYLRGGFKKIVVINGHGGGTERWIPGIIDKLNKKNSSIWPDWKIPLDAWVIGFNWISFMGEYAREELSEIRKKYPGSDWHAGDIETSLQLYLRPELVDMSKAKKGIVWHMSKFAPMDLTNWHRQFIIDGYYPDIDKGEIDIYGDPTSASKELGEKIFNLVVGKISEFIKEMVSKRDWQPIDPRLWILGGKCYG